MSHPHFKHVKRWMRTSVLSRNHSKPFIVGAGVSLLVLVAGIIGLATRAAGGITSAEPENGTLSSQASLADDASASGGKAVKFKAPAATGTGCQNPVWTSSAAFGSFSNGGYVINNNIWNTGEAGPQTISACSYKSWSIVSNQPGSGSDDSVKTYADTQKHVNIPLSTMTTIPSSYDVTTPSGGGTVTPNSKQWNASYDLWLDDFGTEVMIWNNWTMNWQYWYNNYSGQIANIDGVNYYAYHNSTGGLWFIRQNITSQGSVDIASVLRWSVSKGWLTNSQVLGEIEYGFEVSYTGTPTTFTLNDYSLTAN